MRPMKIYALLVACIVSLAISASLLGCGGGQEGKASEPSPDSSAASAGASADEPSLAVESLDSADWKSYSIRVNGRVFTLPFMLSDLDSTGLLTKIYSPGYQQSDGRYQTAARTYSSSPDSAYLGTNFYADSEDPQADEIEVDHVTAQKKADAQADFEVTIPGGITWGESTIDDAIAVYGEPDEVEDGMENARTNYGISKFYSWLDESQGTTNGRLEIGIDDAGTIVHIYLATRAQRN